MSKAYDIEVEPERVQLFSVIEVQYEGPEDLDEDENSVYEDYRTIFGSVTKKWVEETLLYPLDNAITGSQILSPVNGQDGDVCIPSVSVFEFVQDCTLCLTCV